MKERKNKMKKILLLLTLLLAACTPQMIGSPEPALPLATPMQSIQSMINAASAGSVIVVPPGVYNENVSVNKNITLQASGHVIIDGTGLPVQSGGGLINIPANVVASVQGFEVKNGGTYGISVFSTGSTIANNTIHDIKGAGLWVRDAKNNSFLNNEIYKTVQNNSTVNGCSTTNAAWESAINSWGTSSWNVYRGNYIHDNCGEGIVAHSNDTIEGNTFRNNWSIEIYLASTQFTKVLGNTITNDKPYTVRGSDQSWRAVPAGISIGDEAAPCIASDNTITGNVITGLRYGLSFYAYPNCASTTGIKNTVISGNTITGSREYAFRILTGNHANSSIVNNIISVTGSVAHPFTIQSGAFTITGNLIYADTPIFEYNGKQYNWVQWSALVPGNLWGQNTTIPTDTPQPATPVITLPPSLTPTLTKTATITAIPATRTATPTPKPTGTPTVLPTACTQIFSDAQYNFLACTP